MNSFDYGRQAIRNEELFFVNTYRRLVLNMVVLALMGASAAWVRYGSLMACVFTLGCAIALVNFYWLRRSVEAMGARAEEGIRSPSRASVLLRFLLRYLLIAVAAYAILKSTAGNLNGLFAGLSIPVGAILIEAIYQVFAALRT